MHAANAFHIPAAASRPARSQSPELDPLNAASTLLAHTPARRRFGASALAATARAFESGFGHQLDSTRRSAARGVFGPPRGAGAEARATATLSGSTPGNHPLRLTFGLRGDEGDEELKAVAMLPRHARERALREREEAAAAAAAAAAARREPPPSVGHGFMRRVDQALRPSLFKARRRRAKEDRRRMAVTHDAGAPPLDYRSAAFGHWAKRFDKE